MTLHYPFPQITHIDQVRKAIFNRPEYIVVEKEGGYTVVNYVYSGEDTFPPVIDREVSQTDYLTGLRDATDAAILRECRGLIFCSETGVVISRRFHKFFNAGERADVVPEAMIGAEYDVLEKLDGSMITPIPLKGGFWRWGTKMGVTDVALPVEEFVLDNSQYVELADYCKQTDWTPIFEWCSPLNRIVLQHTTHNLILTAIRHNVTGEYMSYARMSALAGRFDIPVVRRVNADILANYRESEGVEGYVLRFANGHMMKFKTEWYVRLHKTKDKIAREVDVAQLVFDDQADDLLPLLDEDDKARLIEYRAAFWRRFEDVKNGISLMLDQWRGEGDRRNFAIHTDPCASQPRRDLTYPSPWARTIMFTAWDGKVPVDTAVRIAVSKGLVNNRKFAELKEGLLQGLRWKEAWEVE